jgi:hypothetical protein
MDVEGVASWYWISATAAVGAVLAFEQLERLRRVDIGDQHAL